MVANKQGVKINAVGGEPFKKNPMNSGKGLKVSGGGEWQIFYRTRKNR